MNEQGVDAAGVPRRRIGLRLDAPGRRRAAPPQGAPRSAATVESVFAGAADRPATDRDVLFSYQIFLGRDPENSFVIAEAKGGTVADVVRGMMQSTEFRTGLSGLGRGGALPHERAGLAPTQDQVAWVTQILVLPADIAAAVRAAPSWRRFWGALATLPGLSVDGGPAPEPEAAPALASEAAEPGDGFVLITLDQPQPGVRLSPGGVISGSGWAIADSDVLAVSVYLDETLLGHARYGLPRPDVARNFPHYRHVDHCGFTFSASIPTDAVIAQGSELIVTLRSRGGGFGRKGVRVEPPAAAMAAAEAWPIRLFVEDARVDAGGSLRVRGWAVSRKPLQSISLHLGDTPLGDASHGLARRDIAQAHADYPNAAGSGFHFQTSLAGHPPGPVQLRVEAEDTEGRTRQAILPVTVPPGLTGAAARASQGEAPARLVCDRAEVGLAGEITVRGWVLAESAVRALSVEQGGRPLGQATLGLPRPDVGRRFPERPEAAEAGFAFRGAADAEPLAPGDLITLRLTLADGGFRALEVALEAGSGAEPESLEASAGVFGPAGLDEVRLEIDRPELADGRALAPVRGALTISGWTTARAGIARVRVRCDDAVLGEAYLGMRREDIARAFPDNEGSLRAGFAMVLPPGAVPQGRRQFEVTAEARGGGSVSRNFEVLVEPPEAALPGSVIRTRVARADLALAQGVLAARGFTPAFQVIVRAASGRSEAPRTALRETLASLAAQALPPRQVVVLAGSAAEATRTAAEAAGAFPALSAMVGAVARGRALPPAPTLPPGETALVVVLEAGDRLGADALLALAQARALTPDADFLYADEAREDPSQGQTLGRTAPLLKPAFSPTLLRSMNYVGRPWCADAALLARAGVGEAELGRESAYGLVLRLTEAARSPCHVPVLLAETGRAESAAREADALREAAARAGQDAEVEPGRAPGLWRVRARAPAAVLGRARVSVIMPTAGRGGLVRTAIETLRATAGARLDIVVADNVPESEAETKAWIAANADRVVQIPGRFNWSRFNNEAARAASGDVLLFLNDDIEAREEGWLEALLEHALRPEVGVVGARLLYPDGKVQHNGQYLSGGHARHAFRFADGADPGPFGLAFAAREMIAVTGACQMIRREVFERLGGFDEAHDIVNNDLDFCLRARAAGLSVVFTPHAELIHHELASRAALEDSYDEARFAGAWGLDLLRGDPFHPPGLLADSDHMAPEPEPVVALRAGPAGPEAASIRRILAVKLDHIGDFLTSLPAIRALAARFPQARISLLAPPATRALAADIPEIAEVIEFSFFHARSSLGRLRHTEGELAALAARLAPERFDLAIDLRLQPETREVLRASGAGLLAGYDHAGAFPWLDVALEWEGDLRLMPKHAHVSERLVQLVDAVATACAKVPPAVVPPAADWTSVPALARLGAGFLAGGFAVIHPGVGNPVRQWPPGHFGALADLIAADLGLNVVLVGGPDEQAVAREAIGAMRAPERAVSLAGALSLAELTEVLRCARLFVGNNSGPKHVAAALGVPTVGIHSGVVDAAEWAPIGPAAVALQRRVICGPCYLEFAADCPRAMACLTGIRPRDVLRACRAMLALRPPPVAAGPEAGAPPARQRKKSARNLSVA